MISDIWHDLYQHRCPRLRLPVWKHRKHSQHRQPLSTYHSTPETPETPESPETPENPYGQHRKQGQDIQTIDNYYTDGTDHTAGGYFSCWYSSSHV